MLQSDRIVLLTESFYSVKYGSSIITSNVCQKNLSNENCSALVFPDFKNGFTKSYWRFNLHFGFKTFILDISQITEKNQ